MYFLFHELAGLLKQLVQSHYGKQHMFWHVFIVYAGWVVMLGISVKLGTTHDKLRPVVQNASTSMVKRGFLWPPIFLVILTKKYHPYWLFQFKTQVVLTYCW